MPIEKEQSYQESMLLTRSFQPTRQINKHTVSNVEFNIKKDICLSIFNVFNSITVKKIINFFCHKKKRYTDPSRANIIMPPNILTWEISINPTQFVQLNRYALFIKIRGRITGHAFLVFESNQEFVIAYSDSRIFLNDAEKSLVRLPRILSAHHLMIDWLT